MESVLAEGERVGVTGWVVKPVEIDDVPILIVTLWSDRPDAIDFVTEDSRPLLEQQLNMVPRTVHRRYEIAFRHKDGRVVDLLVSGTTLRSDSGKLLGSFGLFSDITDRKAAGANSVVRSV